MKALVKKILKKIITFLNSKPKVKKILIFLITLFGLFNPIKNLSNKILNVKQTKRIERIEISNYIFFSDSAENIFKKFKS